MNAGECVGFEVGGLELRRFGFAGLVVDPSPETEVPVEEQGTGGGTFADEECCAVRIGGSHEVEEVEVGVGEDVDIVDKERFAVVEEGRGVAYAATCLEEEVSFVGDVYAYAEVVVHEIGSEEVGEVVNVDDDVGEAGLSETLDDVPDERFAVHFDKRFRPVVGERSETCAESGGEDHGFHGGVGID